VLHLRQSAVQRSDQFVQYPDVVQVVHRFSLDVVSTV
jgi:hypothetical protein